MRARFLAPDSPSGPFLVVIGLQFAAMDTIWLVLDAVVWFAFGFCIAGGPQQLIHALHTRNRAPATVPSSHEERLTPREQAHVQEERMQEALRRAQQHVDAMHEANNVSLLLTDQGDAIRVLPLDDIQDGMLRAYAMPRVPMPTHWAPRKHTLRAEDDVWMARCGACGEGHSSRTWTDGRAWLRMHTRVEHLVR